MERNKFTKNTIRIVSRKDKKALKAHPCTKTKRGRFIIDVLDSRYDYGVASVGYYNGCEIIHGDYGFEHPKGAFFSALINRITPWKIICEYQQEDVEIDENFFDL